MIQIAAGLVVGLAAVAMVRHERRRRERARQSHWMGTVLRFEHTRGRPRAIPGGGHSIQDADSMHVWVYYRRDDGVESYFWVKEHDFQTVSSLGDDGRPSYDEVMRHWQEGDRIEKPPGATYPRRCNV